MFQFITRGFIVEDKLKQGIEKYGAKNGVAILMEPKTGKVRAMAAYPSYDPATYSQFEQEFFKNPAISDSFEPGSIFKPLVMAAALDSKAIEVDTVCDICGGPVKVDKYTIETWNKKYKPDSSMTEIIVHSDNVGMTFIGQKLGTEKLYDYLKKYGLGSLTGIDLQGEATPALREKNKWNIVDLATATFGQGIAVTPIQIIKAFSAIANNGKMVTPQIVEKIVKDGKEQNIKTDIQKEVISESVAAQTTAMMVEAVEKGEAKWTYVPGFKVAGKTGTAQIPDPKDGGYYADRYLHSFFGYFPAYDPEFLIFLYQVNPKGAQYASETLTDPFSDIVKFLINYYNVAPDR